MSHFTMIKIGLLLALLNPLATTIAQASMRNENSSSVGTKPDTTNKKRIIALAPHIVELLYDIGAGEQIIATSSFADYPPQATELPVVGNHSRLQIERIIQLQPDLVLAWRSGTPLDDLERISELGIQVRFSDPKDLEDIAAEVLWLGSITGHRTEAQQIAGEYSDRLTRLRERYQQQPPISVFYEIWSGPLQTISANAWPQKQLEVCGATNIVDTKQSDYPTVSLEQVLTNNPQVIIQPQSNTGPQKWFAWQQYPMLQAVKNDLIIHPDANKAYRMTLRVLDEIEFLCEKIAQARHVYFVD